MAAEQTATTSDPAAERTAWETPDIRTIRAGEAEQGGINNSDGVGFS